MTHIEHRFVLVQHLAVQFADPGCASRADQSGQKKIANTAPLPVASHGDGKFGTPPIRVRNVTRDANRYALSLGEERISRS